MSIRSFKNAYSVQRTVVHPGDVIHEKTQVYFPNMFSQTLHCLSLPFRLGSCCTAFANQKSMSCLSGSFCYGASSRFQLSPKELSQRAHCRHILLYLNPLINSEGVHRNTQDCWLYTTKPSRLNVKLTQEMNNKGVFEITHVILAHY